ncbi:hypothetical protein [Turicibacter sanguinis]|uniref:hypothetical protein n=1 Tax=Turicibacter sanguinis TaxID=154288 RepID=UPI0021D50147|nr:hypothetical protein [Turicibacter sanguinis]MCU7202462.1 hypothetical protein [Turicibacter sanguinis]
MSYKSKRWVNYEDFIKYYVDENEEYRSVYAGFRKVYPKNIVGLSLWSPEDVMKDKKMKWIEERVKDQGWDDNEGRTICLGLSANGIYSVTSGGNHRAILANKLELETIMASVDVLIPNSCLSKQEVKEVRELEEGIDEIRKEEARIRLKYDRAKITPLSPLEQVRLNLLYGFESLKQAKEIKIDNIYKSAAVREKVVPVDYFCNMEIIL